METKSRMKILWTIIGCALLLLVLGWIWRIHKGHKSPTISGGTATQTNQSIPLVKGSWTPIDTMGLRCEEVSISPPARRIVMVNNDPSRIFHLPAGIDNSIYLGRGVTSWKVMIEPDENVSSSKLEYKLVR